MPVRERLKRPLPFSNRKVTSLHLTEGVARLEYSKARSERECPICSVRSALRSRNLRSNKTFPFGEVKLASREQRDSLRFTKGDESFFIKMDMMPTNFFFNHCFDKTRLKAFILWSYSHNGPPKTLSIIEKMQEKGFSFATQAGISIGLDDLQLPPRKHDSFHGLNTRFNRRRANVERGLSPTSNGLTKLLKHGSGPAKG